MNQLRQEKRWPKILILEGAVRSGKTYVNNILFYFDIRMHTGERKKYMVTGHTIGSIKRNVIEPMNDQFGLDVKLNNVDNSFHLYGNTIYCFGADKQDSYKVMTGFTAHGWYGNEVTLQHQNSISEAFNRTSGQGAHIYWDTNPDYPEHPIKTDYIDKSGERLSNGQLRIQSHHFTIDDNPTLDPMYIENLKKSTPLGMWYDRKIKGLWVSAEGLVYEIFDRNMHTCDAFPIPNDWEIYGAVDFGYDNPFVHLWIAKDHDNRLWVIGEHYEAKRLISDHATKIKAGHNTTWVVADHDKQERMELWNAGVSTSPANKAVDAGIQKVAERLTLREDGKPGIVIFRSCKNLIRELGKYAWRQRKEGSPGKEEPIKADDHACDALRYAIMRIDGGSFVFA